MTFLYNCKRALGGAYRITKFDHDLNPESSYLCTTTVCECPAGHRPKCRHREMLPKFIQRNAIDTEWFFDYDRGGWVQGWLEPSPELPSEPLEPAGPTMPADTEPSPILGGFPDWCISSGECTTQDDCFLNGCVHGHGNPPRVTSAGLGQASDLLRFNMDNSGSVGQSPAADALPKPSPSPTIRRRV